jgi:hypothetical protein
MAMRLFMFFAIAASLYGCTHPDHEPVAGKGGNASLLVYGKHHHKGEKIDPLKVYIKYNSLDAPTNGVYDDSVTGVKRDSILSCLLSGLRNGKYYLYATGVDTSVSENLKGGLPYTIKTQGQHVVEIAIGEE